MKSDTILHSAVATNLQLGGGGEEGAGGWFVNFIYLFFFLKMTRIKAIKEEIQNNTVPSLPVKMKVLLIPAENSWRTEI